MGGRGRRREGRRGREGLKRTLKKEKRLRWRGGGKEGERI